MLCKNFLLLFILSFQVTVFISSQGLAFAQQDEIITDDEDDSEADVEDSPDANEGAVVGKEGLDTDEEEEDLEFKPLKASSDADTTFLFTQPSGLGLELPAGKDVHFLVGFANRGSKDFVIESLDASFRYPLDFSFHIQNFTVVSYNRVVKPKQDVSLYYAFYTSETFSARPFGLTVQLFYKDSDGTQYLDAVFNETITIVEVDESLDGETFFLYVFLAACAVLLIVAAQQFLVSFTKRKMAPSQKKIEMGTQNHQNDIDYDWLPKEMLNELNKSPRQRVPKSSPRKSPKQANLRQQQQQMQTKQASPKQSPQRRRPKRGVGAKDE